MPVVPVEENRVGIAAISGAKLRAANVSGTGMDALANGLAKVGQAVGEYAITQDAIQDHADKIYARDLALQYKAEASKRVGEFKSLMGKNAVSAASDVSGGLTQLARDTRGRASNPRMQAYLDEFLKPAETETMGLVADHSRAQQFEFAKNTYASGVDLAQRDAVANAGNPELQGKAMQDGIDGIDRLSKLLGWDEATVTVKRQTFTSGVHRDVMDRMLAQPDADIDGIAGYLEQHKSQMTSADVESIMRDLQKPMQFRQDYGDFTRAVQGVEAPKEGGAAPAQEGKGWTKVATDVASAIGLAPSDVAAVMSYETGGTFNPNKWGGKNGNYLGLIQFGPDERRKYGIKEGSTQAEWSRAIVGFLTDRGFKKGMGILDLYSTINAGRPGKYNASDGNGTVRSHVDKILAEHVSNGNKWLQGGGVVPTETPRTWDKDSVYNSIDRMADKEGWSVEKRERVKAVADRQVARDEELKGREERQAGEDALKVVTDLGAGFTSINQIPREVRSKMSIEAATRFTDMAQRNAEAKTRVPDNGAESMRLQIMQRADPEAFKRVDLTQYVGKVSGDELRGFVLKQAELAGQPGEDDDFRSGITSAIEWGKKYGGVKVDEKNFAAVYDTMESQLLEIKRAKGRIEAGDYNTAFNAAVKTVHRPGVFGELFGGREVSTYQALSDIPPEVEADIRSNWKGAKPPTKGQVIDVWRQRLMERR